MALLNAEPEVASGSASGSGGAVVPLGGYAHRLSDAPEGDDPKTNLLGMLKLMNSSLRLVKVDGTSKCAISVGCP